MPKRIRNTRKARFQAALIRAGYDNQGEWAEQNGMGREHLNRVLNGRVDGSAEMLAKIDAFIADVEAKVLAA